MSKFYVKRLRFSFLRISETEKSDLDVSFLLHFCSHFLLCFIISFVFSVYFYTLDPAHLMTLTRSVISSCQCLLSCPTSSQDTDTLILLSNSPKKNPFPLSSWWGQIPHPVLSATLPCLLLVRLTAHGLSRAANVAFSAVPSNLPLLWPWPPGRPEGDKALLLRDCTVSLICMLFPGPMYSQTFGPLSLFVHAAVYLR